MIYEQKLRRINWEHIGRVLDVDVDINDTGWGSFLRVRVELNLSKQLTRKRTPSVLDDDLWIPVKYEKLPKFCFDCGRILYEEGGCLMKELPIYYPVWSMVESRNSKKALVEGEESDSGKSQPTGQPMPVKEKEPLAHGVTKEVTEEPPDMVKN